MKFFIIAYTIKNPGKDKTPLYKALQSFPKSLPCMENVWLIGADQTPTNINALIKPFFDTIDNFIIIEAKKNYYGWLPTKAWEWMEENMTKET